MHLVTISTLGGCVGERPDAHNMVDKFQNDFVFNETLNDTDKVLVELLRNCDNADYYLSRLGRGKREKLKKHVYNNSVKVEYDLQIIYRLYNDYKVLLGF